MKFSNKSSMFYILSLAILLSACGQSQQHISQKQKNIIQPVEFMPRVTTTNADGADGILIKFKSNTGSVSRARSLQSAGLIEQQTFSLVPGLSRAEPLPGFTVEQTLQTLAVDTSVAYAEPDYILSIDAIPNDPRYNEQYGLSNLNLPGADISAEAAWDINTGSHNVVIAVIDSGVDYNHLDLQDNIWQNIDEIPNNGIDDDNNGYIDDVRGWNFNSNNNNPMDDNNHGTHVAGVIGASGNNNNGIAGINWNVQIMPLKFMNSRGQGRSSAAINSLEYAVANGARVSNNSWGGGAYSQAMFDAIQAANVAGHLFIAAAGNDGTNNDRIAQYPANYNLANIISVAATDDVDSLASFSNFGASTVDIAAPGVGILSTIRNNQYRQMSGTSMATPFVTGAIGLMLAQNNTLSIVEVRDLLLNNVDNISSVSSNTISGGRLNIFRSLSNVSTLPSTPSPLPTEPTPINPVNPTPVTPVDPTPTPPVPVTAELTITPNVQDVAIGSSKQLNATGGVPPYTWSVDNLTLASIEPDSGVFTALTVGEVNVTVTDNTGIVSLPYAINLIPMGILPKDLVQVGLSETITFSADGGVGPYSWEVSDPNVAEILPLGADRRDLIVSPISTGAFTITLIDTTANSATTNHIEVIVPPLVVTPLSAELNIGESLQLVTSGGTSPYIYNSVNPTIVSVDGGGLVTGQSAGTTSIQITDFNDQTMAVNITVLEALNLDQTSLLMSVNSTATLTATGGSGIYQWQTSNSSVVTVNASGVVAALNPGVATITVTDSFGISQTASVEVRQVTLTAPTSLVAGDAASQLTVSGGVGPYGWSSSDTTIASVDANGLVTPIAAGTVILTVADIDGFSASATVTVNPAPEPAPAPTPAPAPAPAPTPAPTPAPAPAPAPTGGHH